MSKLLATDLDGTLMHPHKFTRLVPKKNVKFLRKWIDNGNRLVLVTSRGPEFIERLQKEIDRDLDYICYTSSLIKADGNIIKDESMDSHTISNVLNMINETYHPVAYLMNMKDQPLLIKDLSGVGNLIMVFYKLYWIFQGKKREKYILDNRYFDTALKSGNIYKVIVFFGFRKKNKKISKEINKNLRESFPEVESSWSSFVNEITPHNCNKGAGLQYYCEHLGIKKEDVYVVGDSGNDITMFNLFHENSYAMAKAYPSVKKYAKHVISRVYKLDKIVLKKENE